MAMTSKERVRTTLRHEEPDRVPVGEIGIDCELVERVLGRESFWRGWFKTTQAYWDGRRDEVVDSLKRDIVELTLKLGLDMVPVFLVPSKYKEIRRPRQVGPGLYEDDEGNQFQYSEASTWLIQTRDVDAERELTVEQFERQQPEPPDDSELELIRYVVETLGPTHYVFARDGDATFPFLGGMEAGLMLMATQPEVVRAAIEAGQRQVLAEDLRILETGVDALSPSADYAGTTGPMINPRLFRDLCFPAIREHCAHTHAHGVDFLKHACGNNWALLDMFVEAGMDAYQGIQGSATMDIRLLKERYGDRITLWGGVQVESLVLGTPDDVRADALYALRHAAPGGGFIFGSSHSIATGAKYDNYMAMLDTLARYGSYPIEV